jgi:two-component system chemotaxis sensor kinase CheA
MTIDISQFFQAFFDEADELLEGMEKQLLAVDVSTPDPEHINAIFRAAHSIKGSAGTFNFNDLSDLTHLLESLLDKMRKGALAITTQHIDAFLNAKDVLKMQVAGHRSGSAVDKKAVSGAHGLLQSLLDDAGSAGSAKPVAEPQAELAHAVTRRFRIMLPKMAKAPRVALEAEFGLLGTLSKGKPAGKRMAYTLDTANSADDISAICLFVLEPNDFSVMEQDAVAAAPAAPAATPDDAGYGFFEPAGTEAVAADPGYGLFEPMEPDAAAAAAPAASNEEQGYGFFEPLPERPAAAGTAGVPERPIVEISMPVHAETPPAPVEHKPQSKREVDKAGSESSIRVSIEKVDELMNLVGELVITHAMIEQRAGGLDAKLHERLLTSIGQLTRNTRDLQDAVMSIRMMPMDYVFSRYPRMVRDLAHKLGKKVEFMTHGAATELDKGLIERIIDPLTHLIRNSVDHGIETPQARLAAGKEETGRLSLSARHQGGNIMIEVSDDGGGLNRQKILAKARQQDPSIPETLPDADVWNLIFLPGFSTAEAITDISGRGVGMDVVKRNIEAMGGNVDIRSAHGFGTTVSISLPLTLAIMDGMSIKVGDEIYILPLGYVIESLRPDPDSVKEISGQGRVVKVRGEYLPLIPLYQLFGIEPRYTDPVDGIIVILESDSKVAALFVDELVGQHQVVVKNLESNYRKVMGISGATILGDGGVSLIIDVAALLRSSRQLVDVSNIS